MTQQGSCHNVNSSAVDTSVWPGSHSSGFDRDQGSPSLRRTALITLVIVAIGALTLTLAPTPHAGANTGESSRPWTPAVETQSVRILGIGEFSGALSRPVGFQGELRDGSGNVRPAGGGAHLAATVGKLRDQAGDALLLATGDSIGGTAPEAALLGDRPTIEFFNRLGVDGAGVGRRELEKGADHTRALVRPGCRTEQDCRVDPPLPPFRGAAFPFLASNVIPSPDAAPTFPFAIHRIGDVRVGVVAVTLPSDSAPETTTRLADPVRAVNETVESLKFLGVEAIVGLVQSTTVHGNLDPGACPDELTQLDLVKRLNPAVDALIVGASGGPATCRVLDADNDERVVVAPASHGRSVTVVDLAVDPSTGDVIRPQTSAFNQTVNLDIAPDPGTEELVRQAGAAAAPEARKPLGSATESISRGMDANGESPLANVIADCQLHATRGRGAQLALSNPDSLRTDLPQGPLDYATLHTVQPYGDRLYLVTVTGQELQDAFDYFADDIGNNGPAVSSNVSYTVDTRRPAGERVTELLVDDEPVDPGREYTVVVNEFLSSPEFNGSPLAERGERREAGLTDIDALLRYVTEEGPLRAPDLGRVRVVN
ncbi:bifunctional metallophosphatase/5'-nucleotidase [Dietzia psychralcaliphila]|uniref:Bifunctional metallophosphatase/5'-nucleotidase n=1 Tax=Dietzia psychralcaliphila TaxID=139021 RepID=A0AAD0NM72_9ACTN|nr:5'-nucleotidase C-terminal domain-containing protein [Dietzia psychralcaliphila]AWH94437.1 bifunctional metallophosphatase/5'-nucleotidase [Dietzia psychralcaliphila]PTM88078.1 5'-nucleotidase [Dietzia psychralcaliphila]